MSDRQESPAARTPPDDAVAERIGIYLSWVPPDHAKDARESLDSLIAQRDRWKESSASFELETYRLVAALDSLRAAWNAHMETCPQHASLPDLPAPTWADFERWRNAPSNTASADLFGGDDGNE